MAAYASPTISESKASGELLRSKQKMDAVWGCVHADSMVFGFDVHYTETVSYIFLDVLMKKKKKTTSFRH